MDLQAKAEVVATRLAERQERLVLAESCTGGLICATLATIPGISQWLCGSSVVYRETTKRDWLGIDDASPLLTWEYEQEKCKRGQYGVRIQVEGRA